jgi:hypothetical protein
MDTNRQEIIETLIFSGPLTAQELAGRFEVAWADILVLLLPPRVLFRVALMTPF